MRRVVADLLDASRITQGRLAMAASRRMEFFDEAWAKGAATRLAQVVNSLLTHALRYGGKIHGSFGGYCRVRNSWVACAREGNRLMEADQEERLNSAELSSQRHQGVI